MNKKQKVIIGSVALISFLIAFYFCNYYPLHIVDFGNKFEIKLLFFNMLFFSAFTLFFIKSFATNTIPFMEKSVGEKATMSKASYIVRFSIILILKIGIDFMVNMLKSLMGNTSFFLRTVINLVFILVFYLIASFGKDMFLKRKSSAFIFVLSFAAVMAISVLFDKAIIDSMAFAEQRFSTGAILLDNARINAEYYWEIKALISDIIIGIDIIILHFRNAEITQMMTEKKEEGNWIVTRISKFILKCGIIVLAFLIISILKSVIIPMSSLYWEDNVNNGIHTSYKDGMPFISISNDETEHISYRKIRTDGDVFYISYKGSFSANGEEKVITNNRRCLNKIYIKDNMYTDGIEYDLENDSKLIAQEFIGYYDEGFYSFISVYNLDKYAFNDNLINVCEDLLSSGNVYYFEFFYNYLSCYDKQFIMSFVERYAESNFTERENDFFNSNHYNREFVVSLSKEIKKNN